MAGMVGGRWHPRLWLGAGVLLLAPAALMLVTREMDWGPGDFLAWGLMLAAAAAGLELVLRLVRSVRMRWLLAAGVVAAFLLVWAELAVGIFGPG